MSAATTAPWLRAPLLLLRRPVVFAAIAAASAVLAVAAASGPLFLSTVATASLAAQSEQRCPEASQPGVVATVRDPGAVSGVAATARDAMRARGLPAPNVVSIGETRIDGGEVHVFAGPGALRHVQRLTPARGAGVWVPDGFAEDLRVRPGDTLRTGNGTALPVAGIYRDLAPSPFELADLPRYFCSWNAAIVPAVSAENRTPPPPAERAAPLLITDAATVARTVDETRLYLHSPLSASRNPVGRFATAETQARGAAADVARAAPAGVTVAADPSLGTVVDRARAARTGIAGSVVPIELAGVVVAALLVGGAGAFWSRARSREIRLLVSRGVGPVPLGAKAVLETLPAAVVGAAAGWLATAALVRGVGPARVFEDGALLGALGVVVAVLVPGLALIGVIGGRAARERTTGRRASPLRHVPWELALIAAAVVMALTKLNRSAITVDGAIVRVSPLVLVYPLLGATGVVLLVGRLVALLLPAAGNRAGRAPVPWYLALRRMSRSRSIVVGVLVGTALPCALLMYAATVRQSVGDEVTAKYRANLGAPHVLQLIGVRGELFDLRGNGTQVVRYDGTLGGAPVAVLGVDTATFSRFAFVDADERALVGRLRTSGAGAAPVVVANADGASGSSLQISDVALPVRTISRPAVFPGLRDGSVPLVVIDQRVLSRVDTSTNTAERVNQAWTDDAHYAAAKRLTAARGYSVLVELTSELVVGTTGLLPVTWIFGYLQALAVLIGVVAVAGLVFGLASRTRARRVAYVLSRRMGMKRRAHVASLLVELTSILGVGWVVGSALSLAAFRLIVEKLDVYPRLPPPAPFPLPVSSLAVSAVVVGVVVVAATVSTQLLAQRTKPAEILRLE